MAYKKKSTPKDLIARPVMSETSTNLSRKSSTSSTSSSSSFTSDEEEEGVSSKYVSDFSHDEHRESESNESIVNNSANQVGHSPAPIDASRSTSEGPSTSPTDSVNMSVENRDDGDKSTVEEVEHVNVHQIAEAIKKLDKRMKVTQIRPPWRDPNSQTLPSDQTASFMDMYDEFMRPSKFRPFSANQRLEWQPHIAVNRPYHTTLNRYREQERIQMQNYLLAKRLQDIRPTRGMTRMEQLRDYKRYFIPSTCYNASATTANNMVTFDHSDRHSQDSYSGDRGSPCVYTRQDSGGYLDGSGGKYRLPQRTALSARPRLTPRSIDVTPRNNHHHHCNQTAAHRQLREPPKNRRVLPKLSSLDRKCVPRSMVDQYPGNRRDSCLSVDTITTHNLREDASRGNPVPPPPPSPTQN